MESIPKLNRLRLCQWLWVLFLAVVVASPVALLWQRLRVIYAPPNRVLATTAPDSARREDGVLFKRAVAAGLLRLEKTGQIAIAPIDLPLRRHFALRHPTLLIPRQDEFDWFEQVWDEQLRQLHRALYFSPAGRYIRQEIEHFNASQQLTAIRWRAITHLLEAWSTPWPEASLNLVHHGVLPVLDRGMVGNVNVIGRGPGPIQYDAGGLIWRDSASAIPMTAGRLPPAPLSASATSE
jgi:hypothetical protein